MNAADIVYVDHDPLIPTHLGTDAPHVHVRSTDRCLRRPEGVECLSPAELRAEVERLRDPRRIGSKVWDEVLATIGDDLIESMKARAESAEAERDALQQRLDNVQARHWEYRYQGNLYPLVECGACGVPWPCATARALDGPAAPPRWDEETDALFVDAAQRAAPPQEPQPTPEAGCNCADPPTGRLVACPAHGLPRDYEVWDDSVAPGGMVCRTCGFPVESEPCYEHNPIAARQSGPVERITDANGDETERGADTDTETTHQQDEGAQG